jgi:signal transduction histidine kinase
MMDIAHNLQTPLAVVTSEISYMKEHAEDLVRVSVFEKGVEKLSSFIYRLLHIARLDEKLADHKKEIINLSELLQEHIEYFSIIAHQEQAVIHSDIQLGIFIKGDARELEECFANIVSNALKYKKKHILSEIRITLKTVGNNAEVSIGDNGVGIKEGDLQHVFDRLFRINNDTRNTIEGSGLGLSICKRIADRHEGELSVESVWQKGTVFKLILPLCNKIAEP